MLLFPIDVPIWLHGMDCIPSQPHARVALLSSAPLYLVTPLKAWLNTSGELCYMGFSDSLIVFSNA